MKPWAMLLCALGLSALGLSACDGLGAAVVGPLPTPEVMGGRSACDVDPCAESLPEELDLWAPPSDVTAEAACPALAQHMLQGEAALHAGAFIESLLLPPEVGEGPLELRCVSLTIEVPDGPIPFELDLRGITLHGTRILIASETYGRVLLGTSGSIAASALTMLGPIEIVANRALFWGAALSFERGLQQAPAGSFFALETQLTQVAITGQGTLALRRSSLNESNVRAAHLTTELTPWASTFVRADTVEIFEANLFQCRIEAGRFIAAAGTIAYSEFADCIEVTLASVRLSRTRVGRTALPVRLSGGSIVNSYIEADLIGNTDIVQSAILSERVDLRSGAVYNSALCGVAFFGVEYGIVACIRCDEGPPEDICTSAHDEPACPGFETAMCSRGERASTIPEDLMGI